MAGRSMSKLRGVVKTRHIAGGFFGEVWQGEWEGTPVAIKVAKGASRQAVDALLREVEVAVSLKVHPNLVIVYGVADGSGGDLQLVLEYCEDGSLLDWLRRLDKVCAATVQRLAVTTIARHRCVHAGVRAGASVPRGVQITVSQALDVLTQVGRGLRHLHGGGVRHRDLAARNVLVKGRVFKVTDFGLSSVASDTDGARMTSTTIGPVAWRAPETFHLDEAKRQIASSQTDVYMLGGLMFEVLTAGRHAPFFWMSTESLIMLRATTSINTVDAASAARVSIPWAVVPVDDWSGAVDGVERLKGLMSRCLHADPSRRPSMDDFLAELDAIRNPSSARDGGYGEVPDGGYGTVMGSDATVTAAAAASAAGVSAAGASAVSTARSPAAVPADVVDMSQALAAMDALHIAADVADRVCDEMVLAAAEEGHVTGAQFLQIVIDEGVKSALAMRLREKLHITSVVPPRKVRGGDM
jgi:serine/threonine protein kinase